jgi:HEAT repeat protein
VTDWGPPRASIEAECARRGRDAVVEGCERLLRRQDVDGDLLLALAGPAARPFVEGPRDDDYWLRVWGARGLLWAWEDSATASIIDATDDEHWRVREMAAKVVARHHVEDAMPAMLRLRDDDVPRVRAAAQRAVVALTSGRQAD